jgi:hypothetical protein
LILDHHRWKLGERRPSMPRIRCRYVDCVYLESGFCGADQIDLDPELGCLTYTQEEEELPKEAEWEEEGEEEEEDVLDEEEEEEWDEDLEELDEEDFEDDDEDDDDDEDW